MNTNTLQISKRINIKVLALAIVIITAAVIALILSSNIIGTLLLITGVLLFALKGKMEIYEPSGSKVKRKIFYFDKETISKVESAVMGGFEDGAVFLFLDNGSGKMEVIMTADKEFVAVQLFKFIPHRFEEATDHIVYTGQSAKKLIECIEGSPTAK